MAKIRWDKTDMVEITREAYERLHRENRQFREENMMLRRQVNAMKFAESLLRMKELLPPTLTTQQVAEFLQTSTASARQLIVSGKIPGAFQLGERGNWYVLTEKFLEGIESRLVEEQEGLPV